MSLMISKPRISNCYATAFLPRADAKYVLKGEVVGDDVVTDHVIALLQPKTDAKISRFGCRPLTGSDQDATAMIMHLKSFMK